MKFVNEENLGIVALCAMLVFAFATVICVITCSIKAAWISFVLALFSGLVSIAFSNEYWDVEYYCEEELD